MRKKMLCLLLSCTMALGMGFQAFGATAICVGSNYSVNPSISGSIRDTSKSARYASRILNEMGYLSSAIIQPSYSLLNSKNDDDGNKYTEANILYFNGEGDGRHIAWWYPWSTKEVYCGVTVGTKEKNSVQLDAYDNDLSNVDLMLLFGCNSYTMAKKIIPDDFRKYEPRSIVGFNSEINTDDLQRWSNYFMNELAGGATVQQALDYANTRPGYTETSVQNSSRIQGNSQLKIRLSNRSQGKSWEVFEDENGQIQKVPAKASRDLDEIDREIAFEKSLEKTYQVTTTNGALSFDFDNPDYILIANYVQQNIDENFDLNTYQTEPIEFKYDGNKSGNGCIKFKLLVNNLKTDIEYTAIIKENIVTEIMLYKTPVYNVDMSQIPDTLSDISEQELKDMAIKEDIVKEGFYVKKQEIQKRFDTDSMRAYYFIYTTYEDPNGYETSSDFIYGLDE